METHLQCFGIKLLIISIVVLCIGIELLMISIVVQCIGIALFMMNMVVQCYRNTSAMHWDCCAYEMCIVLQCNGIPL